MLRGSAQAKVDEKGRLKLPSGFRALIEPKYGSNFFVTSMRGDCVLVYPLEVWARIEERIARAPSLSPAIMRFRKAVNAYGQDAVMDGQGRILIHPYLRDKAGTRGEVLVLGMTDHLEVWNRAAFEQGMEASPLTDEDLNELSKLGI